MSRTSPSPTVSATGPTRHGTNVAAIAAAVAPDAKIIGLDVFQPGENGRLTARSSDVLAAMDWLIVHQEEHGIVAMNMSFGSGASDNPGACETPYGLAVEALLGAGIVPVAATGNAGLPDGIDAPACDPGVVSVGATYDFAFGYAPWPAVPCEDVASAPDVVACFSNSAPYLDLVAPGAVLGAGGVFHTGTSQAAPHVTGAIAVVRAAHPAETPEATLERLRATGHLVVDPRSEPPLVVPRVDVFAAVAQYGPPGQVRWTASCAASVLKWRDMLRAQSYQIIATDIEGRVVQRRATRDDLGCGEHTCSFEPALARPYVAWVRGGNRTGWGPWSRQQTALPGKQCSGPTRTGDSLPAPQ